MPTTAVMELYGVSYVKETTYGETPTTPTMLELVQNNFKVRPERDKLESRRRLGDAQVVYNRLGRKMVNGDMELELSYEDQDDMIESLFGMEFPTAFTPITLSATGAFDNVTQTLTDSGSGLGDVAVADWVIITGAVDANNNGVFYVTAAAAGVITLAMGATLLADEAASSPTLIQELRIENGLTVDSYTFEGRHTDTSDYKRYVGVVLDTMSVEANEEIATMQIGCMGANFNTATSSLGAPTLATNNAPMDALGGAYQLDNVDSRIRTVSLDIQRNSALGKPLGTKISDEVFRGRIVVTGSLTMYFETKNVYDDFWDETHKSLKFSFIDPTGNYYTFHIYKALLTDVTEDEEDEAVTVSFSFDALRHATNLKTIGLAKYAA